MKERVQLSTTTTAADLWVGFWKVGNRQFRLIVDEGRMAALVQEMKGEDSWTPFMGGALNKSKAEGEDAPAYYGYLLRKDAQRRLSVWIDARAEDVAVRDPSDLRKQVKYKEQTRLMSVLID